MPLGKVTLLPSQWSIEYPGARLVTENQVFEQSTSAPPEYCGVGWRIEFKVVAVTEGWSQLLKRVVSVPSPVQEILKQPK